MQTEKPGGSDIDLREADLVLRYAARQEAQHQAQKATEPAKRDPELDEQVENDWFAMGDQESWIEARPRVPRNWESPRKS